MEPRIANPAFAVPGAYEAFMGFMKQVNAVDLGIDPELVSLRASQINGCGVCLHGHTKLLRKNGETEERITAVGAWRDAPWFTDAERAALALTEAATRMADRSDPVPDAVWDEAARHFDEQQLAALVLHIGAINLFNRVNVTSGQVTGVWEP
jgi:AhpD family alkylhydroperoxidase